MPKPPDGLRTRLAELSPRAVERLGELLDSADERVRLEAAKVILDRHLGRPQSRLTSACTALRRGTILRHYRNRSPSRVGANSAGGCGSGVIVNADFDDMILCDGHVDGPPIRIRSDFEATMLMISCTGRSPCSAATKLA
jgi:hypothetical protein